MLALAFLILIGVALVAGGLHFEFPKGYIYFAMGFAAVVELININLRRRQDVVKDFEEGAGKGGRAHVGSTVTPRGGGRTR